MENNGIISFIKTSFMGVGQCVMQGNWISGILILIGIGYSSWQAALWFLAGSVLATIVAKLFKAPKEITDMGMFGFGGGYVGVIVGTFMMVNIPHTPGELWLLLILCSVLVVPVTMAFMTLFGKLNLSSLAIPVLVIVWLVVAGFVHSDAANHLPHAAKAASDAAAVADPYSWKTVVFGILSGFGQAFMHGNPITGGLVLLAILVNSRIMGIMAVAGGLVVVVIDMWLGFPEARLVSGELLFNSMLTAMALGGFFLYLDYRSVIYALFGAMLAQFAYIAAVVTLEIVHLPAVVSGFVIVTLIFVYAAQGLDFVTPVPMEKISKPENTLLKNADQ